MTNRYTHVSFFFVFFSDSNIVGLFCRSNDKIKVWNMLRCRSFKRTGFDSSSNSRFAEIQRKVRDYSFLNLPFEVFFFFFFDFKTINPEKRSFPEQQGG